MMKWYDYLIVIIPLIFIYGMAVYSRRYIRSVVDFLATGRLCGRYVINVAGTATAISVIGLIAAAETYYKTGFALSFWGSIMLPVSIVLGLTGFFQYRYRETKAMSVGQYLEMRYSRKLRIFAAALRSLSEMLANMIMPAVAARFFIYFLGLPEYFHVFGIPVNTFGALIIISLILAISIICFSGDLGIVITDTLQGLLLYILMAAFIVFILLKFSWYEEIAPVMFDRVPGENFLNPYDISSLRDFNFFSLLVTFVVIILHRGSWVTGVSSRAKTPHEQKMGGLLGEWRGALNTLFYVLIAISMITLLNHKNFSKEAQSVRAELSSHVARQVAPTDEIRNNMTKSLQAIPPQNHIIGKDTPPSDKKNQDTPYLEAAKQELSKAPGGNGNALFQQFRTLYHQMMLAVSMRHLLPPGMAGLFLLLMIVAMISTDDSRIYSAAGTIAQDVILPLRKKPFTPKQHMMMIRLVSIGIGVFFFVGSFFMAQLDYITLFMTLMCVMWLGGCGPIMLFGLYSRFGNTAGAWTSLITGMVMGVGSIFLQRKWADIIYPFLDAHGWVPAVGKWLTILSKPLEPYIVWEMNPVKCPINSYELYFFTMALTLILYCTVSWFTGLGKEKFNLDRMLHRGAYADTNAPALRTEWNIKTVFSKLIGITPEYSRGDKWIAWSLFVYSIIYKFFIIFVLVAVWNMFSPFSAQWWGNYFLITVMVIPGIVTVVTAVWFTVGGVRDMLQLFRDLKNRSEINELDDGRVEGNVSLADKKAFEKIDSKGV